MTISLNAGLQGLSRNPLCGNPSKAGFGAILKPDACKTYDRATLTVHCVGDSPMPPLVVGALLIVLAMLSWRKGARTQSTIDRPSL